MVVQEGHTARSELDAPQVVALPSLWLQVKLLSNITGHQCLTSDSCPILKKNPHLILVKSKNSSKPPNTFQVIETKYFRVFFFHSFSHLVCFCFCIAWIYFEKKSILHNNIDHIIHITSNISIRKLKLNFLYTFISASENRYYKDLRWYLKNTNPCYFLDLTFFYNHMKLFYRWSNCFLAIGLCGP